QNSRGSPGSVTNTTGVAGRSAQYCTDNPDRFMSGNHTSPAAHRYPSRTDPSATSSKLVRCREDPTPCNTHANTPPPGCTATTTSTTSPNSRSTLHPEASTPDSAATAPA